MPSEGNSSSIKYKGKYRKNEIEKSKTVDERRVGERVMEMEDRLKRLRKAMDRGTFQHLPFTEEKKQMLKRGVENSSESEQALQLHILQLLLKERTGHELLNQLRSRGVKRYENREGFLYSTLHRMEQDRFLDTYWENEAKFYKVSNRGRKLIQQAEKGKQGKKLSMNSVFEGE